MKESQRKRIKEEARAAAIERFTTPQAGGMSFMENAVLAFAHGMAANPNNDTIDMNYVIELGSDLVEKMADIYVGHELSKAEKEAADDPFYRWNCR